MNEFGKRLLQEAKNLDFCLFNVFDVDSESFHRAQRACMSAYDNAINQGFHGEMQYLERGRDVRADLQRIFPPIKSVLCVALAYPWSNRSKTGPFKARFTQIRDYQSEIKSRLEILINEVGKITQTDISYKICVDTSAVLEKFLASAAGLGWIGKNTLLINKNHGSAFCLGEILLDKTVDQSPLSPEPFVHCGSCTACLDACPTRALVDEGQLDARNCISYQTLEAKTHNRNVDTHGWTAGCDLCQEACPHNDCEMIQ